MQRQLVFHHHEFELDTREILNILEGPITEEDIKSITELDCSNYTFDHNDIDTLKQFKNLECLYIEIGNVDLSFLSSFRKLKTLDLVYWDRGNILDFNVFTDLPELESLYISGGDISSMTLTNLCALTNHRKLKALHFHEFGTVDLAFLEKMPWIEDFFCGYANEVINVDSIGTLVNLKSLELIDLEMDNLNFLDHLSDEMTLDLCGDEVHSGIDMDKLKRFAEIDICEITVNGHCIGV